MKQLILATFAVTAAVSIYAQGTVTFGCYNSLGTTHFWGPSTSAPSLMLQGFGSNDSPSGTTPYAASGMIMIGAPGGLAASTTLAQLLYANGANQPASSLVPGGQTTTFRTGNTVGRISLITDTITGLTPDSAAATFQMVAWDNSSGRYPTWTQASAAWVSGVPGAWGMSEVFTVQSIGGIVNTPPQMLIPSFSLIYTPEPSACALAGLGAAVLLIFRRRK